MKPFTDQVEAPKAARKIATVALYGEFGPPILTAARSFRDAGIEAVVLGIGSGKPSLWSNAVRSAALMLPGDVGTPAGISALNNFIQQTNAQALLAFWDPQILWVAANQDLSLIHISARISSSPAPMRRRSSFSLPAP